MLFNKYSQIDPNNPDPEALEGNGGLEEVIDYTNGPADIRHGIKFTPWRSSKPTRPELTPSIRDLDVESVLPQYDLGDVLQISFGRQGFIIAVVDHVDSSGIYGWYSYSKKGPIGAREKATDAFVAWTLYNVPDYPPKFLASWRRVKFIKQIGDAWEEARGGGVPTNLPEHDKNTQFAPVVASDPLVNVAMYRNKYLLFVYTNLARTKTSRRRVEPLYVFIHPNTKNELMLSIDRGVRYFRSFAVPNMREVKLGSIYSFNPDKMLKQVDKTLLKMNAEYSAAYDDEDERDEAKNNDTMYYGLSKYKGYLEGLKKKEEKIKKSKKKKSSKKDSKD